MLPSESRKHGNVFDQEVGVNDLLDISPNPPLPKPVRMGIFCDSLSGNLGLFPTFHVTGLIPGNGQGL